ncbi:GNAT family N-acetyltransferase [Rheinheimera sp. F8]|uniref:GNAT family N-acetyltransferase n=1 Tax=Rheinheimera sp. F8 TaxID=1763998 RepID=UPI000744A420|nr:GNAT family N-acetyltransferase [Rheinheimera sp. F8]ALZ76875.1 GCN5 family acetyltransferase [Rheinheimera sp. F8]
MTNIHCAFVRLAPVASDNYEAVCDLKLHQTQEIYLASNLWSLVEAAYEPGCFPRAIYQQDQLVGFVMWVQETPQRVSIWRLMVDRQFQQQGIGRAALKLALAEIRQMAGVQQIEICYVPTNPVAKDFYASLGFVETGWDEAGEEMLAVINL